ncbi:hypothetical protein FQR65_LT01355 [Abscondita terminalis]|nr:hypothetical protein FQR65_LT01355 [Abscondita terminalis]
METLIGIIPVLTEAQVKRDIVPLLTIKSQLSQPLLARIASCKMLGKVAIHPGLDPNDVKRDIVPLAQALSRDCHPEVRAITCTQFPLIAQGLGSGLIRADLLACLVDLGSDDNMYVRSASVSAIVHIFPYTNLDVKKATLLPLIKQLCDRALKHDDLTATTIAKDIGKLLDGMRYALTIPESIWFLNFYKRLSLKGLSNDEFKGTDPSLDVTCRQQAAINFPAMTSFVRTVIPTQLDSLYSIFKDLAGDPCFIVRRTIAGCIHDIVKTFEANSKMLKSDFVRLLQDDSEEVLNAIVPHLGSTLELFSKFDTLSRLNITSATMEVGRALLKCQYELIAGNNWRLSTMFLHQLEHLPNCMPSDFIHQHFTPVLLTCAVEGRARPVRIQAGRTLLIYLRYNGKEMQRRWLRENLVSQLCRSSSCYTRLIYIKICASAKDIFSDKYFKEYFFENLLDLAVDPIANIRMCAINLFSALKQMLTFPDDKLLQDKFNNVLRRYTNHEKDRDVLEAFNAKSREMKGIDGVREEYKREQKRRRDEEDRINAGGKPSVHVITKKEPTSQSILKGRSAASALGKIPSNETLLSSSRLSAKSPNPQSRTANQSVLSNPQSNHYKMLLISFLLSIASTIGINVNIDVVNSEDHIVSVCNRYFTDEIILVINTNNTYYSVPNVHSSKIIINDLGTLESVDVRINNYVIAFTTRQILNETLAQIKSKRPVWNSRGKFLIATQNLSEGIDDILIMLYHYNIYNSLVLICNDVCKFYSYDFTKSNCGLNITAEPREVSRAFENKISNNVCNVPFLVLWHPGPPYAIDYKKRKNPGMLLSTLNIFGERNNLNVSYVDDYKKYLYEVTYQKDGVVLEDFDNGKGDCFASIIPYDHRKCWLQYDCTVSVGREKFLWILPKPVELALWKSVIRSYSITIWSLYFATILGLVVLFWLFGVVSQESVPFSRWALLVLRVMMGVSENQPPRYLSARLLFVNFSMFSIVMNTLYQAKLYALFNNPGYEKELKTLSDILNSGLPLEFQRGFYTLFMMSGEEGGEVLEKFKPYEGSPNDTLYLTVLNQDRATVARTGDIVMNPHLKGLFDSVTIFDADVVIVMKRDHVLYDLLNFNVQRFFETGFYVKWIFDMELENYMKPLRGGRQKIFKLSMHHLQGVYLVYAMGVVTACVSFVVEVMLGVVMKVWKNTS